MTFSIREGSKGGVKLVGAGLKPAPTGHLRWAFYSVPGTENACRTPPSITISVPVV